MLASYRVKAVVATAAIGAVGVWNVFISLGLPVLGVIAIFFSGRVESGGLHLGGCHRSSRPRRHGGGLRADHPK